MGSRQRGISFLFAFARPVRGAIEFPLHLLMGNQSLLGWRGLLIELNTRVQRLPEVRQRWRQSDSSGLFYGELLSCSLRFEIASRP